MISITSNLKRVIKRIPIFFDSLSNRTKKNDEVCQHNSLNQLIKKDKEELQYDRNGNLIQRGGVRYTYDALDRLVKVEANGSVITYQYDPFNRRLSKNDQLFVYQGESEIGSWINGAFQELCLLGETGRSPLVALELKAIPYVPLHDITGNIVALLNLQGNVQERYRYTAFGETEILTPSGKQLASSAIANPYQYASKRLDPETGFIAFGLRYSAPPSAFGSPPIPPATSTAPTSMPMCI